MEVRLAKREDLPQLRAVYGEIIRRMEAGGIRIWDEIYPCEFFARDIEDNCLYVLAEAEVIVSGFALCGMNPGADRVKWKSGSARALYLDRFGVNADYQGKGLGSRTLREAAALAGELGAEYLRLFVVDVNEPAIRLYEKNGFQRAEGIFNEDIGGGTVLHEYGYEIQTAAGVEARECGSQTGATAGVELRPYRPEDCREMGQLFYDTVRTVNRRDYTEAETEAWAPGLPDLESWNQSFLAHYTLVAWENGRIAGFGDIDRAGYLDRLYVGRDCQGRGIATAICSRLEAHFPVDRVTACASITARPFFADRGYRVLRRGVYLTNFVMEKRLEK